MNVVIVEDEAPAARRLKQLILQLEPNIQVVAVLDSIETAVHWFLSNPLPDLAFFDIELADGQSFEIFNKVQVTCPVVFTTAYDAYALKAFEVNSIDYLLKPIEQSALLKSLSKWRTVRTGNQIIRIEEVIHQLNKKEMYKSRFLIKIGDKMFYVETSDIAYFVSEEKYTWLITKDKRKYVVDQTLDELESMFNPAHFFRVNRQFLCHIQSIKVAHTHFNGKLKIELIPVYEEEVYISREKAMLFKKWMDG